MYHFSAEQKVVKVAGVNLGGQPGEYPTVLMGAIFYAGDRLVPGVNSPDFDRGKAVTEVETAMAKCGHVGVPLILDVICATPEQARSFIGFALDVCDLPVLMDGTTPKVRLACIVEAKERGAEDRIIYNAISNTVKDEELRRVVKMGLKTAIVQLTNEKKPNVRGRIEMARQQVPRAYDLGFENLLLDMAVLDIADVGICAIAIQEIKEEFGLPAGCSPTHTHRNRWKKASLFSPKEQAAAKVSCAAMLQCAGADFIMYDIKQTEVIPAMAMIDAEISYGARTWKIRPQSEDHPIFRVFM